LDFHYFKQVVNLSVTCFNVEVEQFLAWFPHRAGLSATAGHSCLVKLHEIWSVGSHENH